MQLTDIVKKAFVPASIILLLGIVAAFPAMAANLEIQTSPQTIYAYRNNTVQITVSLKDDTGAGLAGKGVAITTSQGTVSAIQDLGGGRYGAELSVPVQPAPRKPGYLLILATAADAGNVRIKAATIPVYSEFILEGHASPGTEILGSAGSGSSRNMTVGENGRFRLSIPIAPGQRSVRVVAKKGAREKSNSVPLGGGGENWLAVHSFPKSISKTSAGGHVFIFALKKDGRPETDSRFTIDCSPGRCSDIIALEPGLFRATYAPDASSSADRATVSVQYYTKSDTVDFILIQPGLAEISITAQADEVYKGQEVVLEITPLDFGGQPTSDAVIDVLANDLPVGRADEIYPGKYRYIHRVQSDEPDDEIEFSAEGFHASASDKIVYSGKTHVRLLVPEVALSIEKGYGAVGPGGSAEIVVRAFSRAAGQAVDGLALQAVAETGQAGAVQALGGGLYQFVYTAPDAWQENDISIEISAPDVPGSPSITHAIGWAASETEATPMAGAPATLEFTVSANQLTVGNPVVLTAEIKDESGVGVAGQNVVFSAPGVLGAVKDLGNGQYSADLFVPENTAPGQLKIRAGCDCSGAGLGSEIEIELLPLPAHTIELAAAAQELYVSDAVETSVAITVKNKLGGVVADEALSVTVQQESDSETLEAVSGTDGSAQVSFELAPPAGDALVTVASENNPSVSQSLTIRKLAYALSKLELKSTLDTLPADGATTLEIEVLAVDEAGNNSSGERMDFNILQGSGRLNATNCTTAEDGRCTVFYTAGESCGTVEVETFSYRDDTIRQTIQITETAKIPATMELVQAAPALIANGADTWTMKILAKDAGECPVPGETLAFSVTDGSGTVTANADTGADGVASVTYTAGVSHGDVTISVRSQTSTLLMFNETFTLSESPPPTAAITLESASANINLGESVDFSSAGSSAVAPATIAAYSWDINGDSAVDSTSANPPAYTYSAAGTYSAVLTVTDTLGKAGSATATVTVATANPTPVITLESSTTNICLNDTVNFTGAGSTALSPATISTYSWDHDGNGAPDSTLANPAAYAYGVAGTYSAALTVTDTLGRSGATATTVTVSAPPTVISLTPALSEIFTAGTNATTITSSAIKRCFGQNIANGTLFTITTSLGTITSADQDAGTPGIQVGSNAGVITFSLQAGAATGTAAISIASVVPYYSGSTNVTISEPPNPTAAITFDSGATSICINDSNDYNGSGSTAVAPATINTFSWDFNGDSTQDSTLSNPAAVPYNATGTYVVSLEITDSTSKTDIATTTITVSAPPDTFTLTPAPGNIYANNVATTTITSSVIEKCFGLPVDDATLFTVTTSLGTITSADQDGAAAGIQVKSTGGVITIELRAGLVPGTASISAVSVDAYYSGTTNVTLDVPPNPTAAITLESGTTNICVNDTVDFTGTGSSAVAPATIASFGWDLDGDGTEDSALADPPATPFTTAGSITVTLTATDTLGKSDTDTTTVTVSAATGSFTLTPTPASINADGAATTSIVSSQILDCHGDPVVNGSLFTVLASRGTIISADEDGAAGIQVSSTGGVITFVLQAGSTPGTTQVIAQSTNGLYSGNTTVGMTGSDTTLPLVVEATPTGLLPGGTMVDYIRVVFSEGMILDLNNDFSVSNGGVIPGVWTYAGATNTAIFTPSGGPINAFTTVVVTVKLTATDNASNGLDGAYTGVPADYVFQFGSSVSCDPPDVDACSDAPDEFSPDPSDALPDSTNISFQLSDNYYLDNWKIEILSGTTLIRTVVTENCCAGICFAVSGPCDTCCSGACSTCKLVNSAIAWDGRDQAGDIVANGVYTYRVTTYDLGDCPSNPVCTGTVTVSNPIDFGEFGP